MNNINNAAEIRTRINTRQTEINDTLHQIDEVDHQIATLDAQIADLNDQISSRNDQKTGLYRQKREHENTIETARNQNAIERGLLDNIYNLAFLQERNYSLYKASQEFLVIPFMNNQYEMPFEIRTLSIVNDMTKDELKYFLRGYNLPDEGNKTQLRNRLVNFFGLPEETADYLYSVEPRRRDIRR